MKKTVLRMLAILMLVISTTLWLPSGNAQAQDVGGLFTTLKNGGKSAFCAKMGRIRKMDDRLSSTCKLQIVAAASQLICTNPNVEGFEGSKCDFIGKKTLGGLSPKKVLIDQYVGATGPGKDFIKFALDIAGVN